MATITIQLSPGNGNVPRFILIPDEGIPEDVKKDLQHRFENDESCRWCGGLHHRECPRVKKITYHPSDDRQVREVEFWGDGEWDKSSVVWPEDIV